MSSSTEAGPSDPSLAPGERLGRYTILGTIGEGAMGIVLAAYDPELDRKVAIKVLRTGNWTGSESAERLLREARAMAKLAHPNVLTVYEVGRLGEGVFLATE